MIVIASTLVVATGVCLAFDTTRLLGVLGVLLLFYFFPIVFLALLLLGGAVIFYIQKRSANHV